MGAVAHRLRVGNAYKVGLNTWYLASNGSSRGMLKARHEKIQEIGIASKQLTGSPARYPPLPRQLLKRFHPRQQRPQPHLCVVLGGLGDRALDLPQRPLRSDRRLRQRTAERFHEEAVGLFVERERRGFARAADDAARGGGEAAQVVLLATRGACRPAAAVSRPRAAA